MEKYKFRAKNPTGREFSPKKFYYQGKKNIVLIGNEATGDIIQLKLPTGS